MRIVHTADHHIRSSLYHKEYDIGFNNFKERLIEDQPDLIVIAGDQIHNKSNLTADLIEMLFKFFDLIKEWPVLVLPGNHDYNVKNPNKKNILEVLKEKVSGNVYICDTDAQQHIKTIEHAGKKFAFHMLPSGAPINPDISETADVRIAVWHGPAADATTDIGHRFMGSDIKPITDFSRYHFGMFGDIHRRQILDEEGRFRYCGSLFQQDFGEVVEKGYLLWDIKDVDDFSCEFREVTAGKNFYTFDYSKLVLDPSIINNCKIDSRIRVKNDQPLTSEQKREVKVLFAKNNIKDIQYKIEPPSDIVNNTSISREKLGNLKDVAVQRELVRAYCKDDQEILSVHDQIVSEAEQTNKELNSDPSVWTISDVSFENFFSYRGNTNLDLSDKHGTIGIFGQNKIGKSGCIDAISFGLYGQTIRPISRQLDIITKEQDSAMCTVSLRDENDKEMIIKRTLTPFKYYGNKAKGVKQYSKTTTSITVDGETTTGDDERDTKKILTQHLGSFEDYLLLSVLSVDRPEFSIVSGFDKPTFKDTLRRLLAVDIFDTYEVICNQKIAKFESALMLINQQLSKFSDAAGDISATQSQIKDLTEVQTSLRKKLELARQSAEVATLRKTLDEVPCEKAIQGSCSLYCAANNRCSKVAISIDDPKELQKQINLNDSILMEKSRLLGALQQNDKDKQDLIEKQNILEKALKLHKKYKEVVGRNGVSLILLKKMLGTLEKFANDIVASITNDFQIKMAYDGDTIAANICDANKQMSNLRTIALGSGMEKLTVEIAFRLALLQMCKIPRLSMFIVDERLSVLDEQSIEEALSLFDYMERFFSHIIIITHNQTLKDTVRHIIEVVKQDGVSVIE